MALSVQNTQSNALRLGLRHAIAAFTTAATIDAHGNSLYEEILTQSRRNSQIAFS